MVMSSTSLKEKDSMNVPLPDLKNDIKPVNKQLTQQLIDATLKELCQTVSQTLGPHGNTVSLQTSTYIEPKITKDGVTVARSFLYRDERQLVSDLVNKALNQVDHVAGDGTTSTTVMIGKLYDTASSALKMGKVTLPQLREQLYGALGQAIEMIDKIRIAPSPELLQKVAFTASNDKHLGNLLYQAIAYSDFVSIEESVQEDADKVYKTTGVQYDQGYISPYFAVGASPRLNLQSPIVLLSDGVLSRVDQIRGVLERAFAEKRPLVVIAADVQGDALNTLLLNQLQRVVQCVAIRGFGYGNIRKVNLNDLAIILGAKQLETQIQSGGENEPVRSFIADGDNIIAVQVDGKNTSFELRTPEKIKKQEIDAIINELKNELKRKDQQSYEADQLRTRIARLGQKSAKVILTGQNSSEKRDRAWDCLMTLRNAKRSGLVKGSGHGQLQLATLLREKIDGGNMETCGTQVNTAGAKKGKSQEISSDTYPIGYCLLSRALEQITVQLAGQFGLNGQYVVEKVRSDGTAFDAYSGKIVKNVDVYDSAESIKQQLQQAVEVVLSLVSIGGIVQEVNK